MTFTPSQVRKLRSRLKPQNVRTREADGISLSYLEGWHVVSEANRIFGFDGWDRETLSSECVWTKQVNSRYCAAYVTRVRIRVRAGDAVITREGSGAGESSAATPGQAHEFAAKAAETDATKRALMTFGNAFGLSLYGGTPEPRAKASPASGMPEGSAGDMPGDGSDVTTGNAETGPTEPETTPQEAAIAVDNPAQPQAIQSSLPVTLPGPDWPQIAPLDEAMRLDLGRQERIDKSALTLSEPRRIRDLGHLAFVAAKPCLVCGKNRTHAHHLKFAQPTALGRKVSDEFTVPLCSLHHRELHQHGDECAWWAARSIDALKVAEELWRGRRKLTTAPDTLGAPTE
jgi:DNA recombination protein Rad52